MCGIAGFLNRSERADPLVVEKQVQTLLHRGPDAWGVFSRDAGAIGQTRLSIIDLDTGDPPIANEVGTIGVALNGEIYNFRELRAGLLERGHVFKSVGDTEVIAHLAEELEPIDLARSLDGMFGVAVWDSERARLTLARDRFGKKPLYYWIGDGTFVFGSELKALFEHPAVPRDLDEGAIGPYLTFGYVPTPDTFFRGIRSLPPGHVLSVGTDLQPSIEPYFELSIDSVARIDEEEAAARVRHLLTEAVRKRLVSDVPLGAFLSGGIDSSAVVGIMAELAPQAVRTFTIGFEDKDGYDERSFATAIARRFATNHTEFVVKPHAAELVDRLVYHYDQPFGDSSSIPTFLLAEMTKKHVTVALSGDGGDEAFAGYERFAGGVAAARYARLPSLIRVGARSVVGGLGPMLFGAKGSKAKRFVERASLGLPDGYRSWIDYVPTEVRARLGITSDATNGYRQVWQGSEGAPTLKRLLDLNIRTYLLDDLLPKTDRMSMAHGLEVRSPFLDPELVGFALSLPPSHLQKGMNLKRVLKRSLEDLLPSDILHRDKHGFGVPLDRWFREDLSPLAARMADPSSSHLFRYLDADGLRALVAEHDSGVNRGHALWTLLTLDVFLGTFEKVAA